MLVRIIVCFALFGISVSAWAQGRQDDQLIPATGSYAARKKVRKHYHRLELIPARDSVYVLGYGLARLPKSLKKMKFIGTDIKYKRSGIANEASKSLDSTYRYTTALKKSLTYTLPAPSDYQRQKRNFLMGRKASSYFSNQWITLGKVKANDPQVTLQTAATFKKHHVYAFDMLPGKIAWELPAIDRWYCEPADIQFFKLRKMQGYGLKKINSTPFTETQRIILRPTFEVYFPHNQAIPDPLGVEKIIAYLEMNNYVILNAMLEGGCSIEGDSVRNQYLQLSRAKVLQNTLHRYTDELLKKDTVKLSDAFDQFRELIRKTEMKYLDTLSDRQLQALVNTDAKLRQQLESIFVVQRKASLKLVVAKRLTRAEQFQKFSNDFFKTCAMMHPRNAAYAEMESRMMGLLEKLVQYYLEEFITFDQLKEVLDESEQPQYLRVLLAYHFIKQFEAQKWPTQKKETWFTYWQRCHIEEFFNEAQNALINLALYDQLQRKRYTSMLVDFQTFTYKFIEAGLIEIQSLCDIPYPERPEFMGLILNQYAYLYEAANSPESSYASATGDLTPAIHCVPQKTQRTFRKDSIINTDKFLEDVALQYQNRSASTYTLVHGKLIKNKRFDDAPKSPYYFLLKQHYVKNNRAIAQHVASASEGNSVHFNVFNLWHLLDLTIGAWDPFENLFYDEEVQLKEMEQLIGLMKRSDAGLCKPQINALYLTYHLKLLYYLERYFEPGNPTHTRYAENSLKFITDYYKNRSKNVNSALALHIIKQLNLFYNLPTLRSGAWYGYDLLNAIAKDRLLNDDELKMYAHYLKLYDPAMKKVPRLYDKSKLSEISQEPFL